jgi:hypothetical protein
MRIPGIVDANQRDPTFLGRQIGAALNHLV